MQLKYYLPDHNPSAFEKASRLVMRREWPVWSFPRIIQIQTISGCNARCVFCPNGKTRRDLPQGSMDWDLYRSLIDECTRHHMLRISPYLMNEPLLDPELGRRIRYIAERKRFPTHTKINTNASLLTEEMSRQLIDSGLDVLTCSVHGIVREKYEKTMVGLKLDQVLAGIDRFLDLRRKAGKNKPELRVTMVRTRLIEPDVDDIRAYWKGRAAKVNIRPMTNRVNQRVSKSISALSVESRPLEPFDWCVRLMQQAYVNVRGQVLLCCNDWEQVTNLGDLTRQSLTEIWNGEVAVTTRRKFLKGDFKGLLCAACRMQKI